MWRIKRQFVQSSLGHDIKWRVFVNEHYVVQTFNEQMQGSIVPTALHMYFFIGEREVIIGCDIVDYAPETLHKYVLGYVGFVQNLDQ